MKQTSNQKIAFTNRRLPKSCLQNSTLSVFFPISSRREQKVGIRSQEQKTPLMNMSGDTHPLAEAEKPCLPPFGINRCTQGILIWRRPKRKNNHNHVNTPLWDFPFIQYATSHNIFSLPLLQNLQNKFCCIIVSIWWKQPADTILWKMSCATYDMYKKNMSVAKKN